MLEILWVQKKLVAKFFFSSVLGYSQENIINIGWMSPIVIKKIKTKTRAMLHGLSPMHK